MNGLPVYLIAVRKSPISLSRNSEAAVTVIDSKGMSDHRAVRHQDACKPNRFVFDETGQMSIFVALIFQVLFVFFAMVINVGLLVHDKINLQNAVDLGAYYAAQRQAELLNEIAHINYQIRQDYKLLAWRYRVLGTLGRHGNTSNPTEATLPPARKSNPGALSDKPWVNPSYGEEESAVCVANNMWTDMVAQSSQDENYCFTPYNTRVPKIPSLPTIAPFVPGVSDTAAFTEMAQRAQQISCRRAGPLNWAFTMRMIFGYKLAIAARKQLIWELRKNLIDPNFRDRNNEPVREGVRVTIEKNLTYANRQSFLNSPDFELINGLAHPDCNRGDGGEFVLPEIRIAPSLLFVNYLCDEGSEAYMVAHEILDGLDPAEIRRWDPNGLMQSLAKSEPEPTSPWHSSLGFEKNPWCMAYVGVKARTRVSKPFAPLGKPIELEARAFAQPFGGRIGPWYRERWTRGSAMSNEGDRVDPLTTPRLLPGGGLDGGSPLARLPNFSRYPGDTIGLKSEISMGAQNSVLRSYGPPRNKMDRLKLIYYSYFDAIPTTGDVLARNEAGTNDFPLRRAEMAAVAPDLFDITYYSIDPNYMDAYVKLGADRSLDLQPVFGRPVRQLPDIGGRLGDREEMESFNIDNQIRIALQGGFDQTVLPKLYYVVRDWTHLLTGWAQDQLQVFTFPSRRFGHCGLRASDQVPVPGQCLSEGGRVGYSVRLISKSHLLAETWKLGGDGGQEGAILNPPPRDF